MSAIWSQVLQKEVDGPTLIREHDASNKAFFSAHGGLHTMSNLDNRCSQLLDEFVDWLSNEGTNAAHFMAFKQAAEAVRATLLASLPDARSHTSLLRAGRRRAGGGPEEGYP